MPTNPPPCHCRTKEVYTKTFSWPTDCRAVSSRRDAVLLARRRAGHTPLLKAYANQIDTTVDPKCPSCGEEPQTVEHWLQRFSKRCSTETKTIRRTIPTALGSYHQPGQRASACQENPSLRALGAMSQQQHQQQQQQQQQLQQQRENS